MPPIFILGTGRCGSSHLQRLISLQTNCWVWGEHDGFLRSCVECVNHFEASAALKESVFGRYPTDEEIIREMTAGSLNVPWLNRISKSSMRESVKSLILTLFRDTIPETHQQWGFKEILYGLHNDVPRFLLELFPDSVIAFTFRNPSETIASMLVSWADVRATNHPEWNVKLKEFSDRWIAIMLYFIDLKAAHKQRLVFVSSDSLADPQKILQDLNLEYASMRAEQFLGKTNQRRIESNTNFACGVDDAVHGSYGLHLEHIFSKALSLCEVRD